jgi:hypothetical protein
MAGPGRRAHVRGGRPHRVEVSYSAEEYAAVVGAATRAGVAVSAWLGETGVRLARGAGGTARAAGWGALMQRLMVVHNELLETRRVLRNVGGNLNDVARVGNASGNLPAETGRVQALVARCVVRVEEAVGTVSAALGDTRPRTRRSVARR